MQVVTDSCWISRANSFRVSPLKCPAGFKGMELEVFVLFNVFEMDTVPTIPKQCGRGDDCVNTEFHKRILST